jgi:hypothetical protein
MFNRVHQFIKAITFNSRLNGVKFIHNKKIANQNVTKNKNDSMIIVNKNVNKNKNNNIIIVRKMSTQAHLPGNNNNNNNNNNKNAPYMFIMALGVYISHSFNKKGKN